MERKTIRLTPNEQLEHIKANNIREPILYEMSIRFVADVDIPSITDMLNQCGFNEHPVVPEAIKLNIAQTIPFIPDEKTLEEYAKVLENTKTNKDVSIHNVRFECYEYIYAVKPDMTDGKETC